MNLFRLLGDLSHLISILCLLHKITKTSTVTGISFKSQFLYLLVFITRYLDLLQVWPWPNHMYNFILKLVFIGTSAYTVYLMLYKYNPSRDPHLDTFRDSYLLAGSAVCALLFSYKYTFLEVSWAFSIFLESVAILPQLFMLRRTGRTDNITFHYLFALGMYRAFYIPNWICRYFFEVPAYVDPIVWIAGIVQTVLYLDFFYIYYQKIKSGKFNLPV